MQLLKEKILAEGQVIGNDILKVDRFLNHQIDVSFLNSIGQEFFQRFKDERVTKILTVEASGIAIACITAQYFKVPVVFAKKGQASNIEQQVYTSEVYSFTRNAIYKIMVAQSYLDAGDRVLIIDDFLANGRAVLGLMDIIRQAGANLVGVGIVIEKGFQEGGALVRKSGANLQSLAIIETMKKGQIVFR
jgi:xanthine phosphoribosyltransferase